MRRSSSVCCRRVCWVRLRSVMSRMKLLNRKPSRVLSAEMLNSAVNTRSVAPLDLDFAAGLSDLFLPGKQKAFQRRPQRPSRARCAHQVEQVLAECFLTGPSENDFGLRIPVPDDAALIDLDEGVDRAVDDAARQLVALAQRLLGAVSLGDVTGDLRYADGRTRGRLDRGNAERDFDRAAVLAQPRRFIVLDAFAPADPAQAVLHLAQPVGGHEDRDVPGPRLLPRCIRTGVPRPNSSR